MNAISPSETKNSLYTANMIDTIMVITKSLITELNDTLLFIRRNCDDFLQETLLITRIILVVIFD